MPKSHEEEALSVFYLMDNPLFWNSHYFIQFKQMPVENNMVQQASVLFFHLIDAGSTSPVVKVFLLFFLGVPAPRSLVFLFQPVYDPN